MMNKPQQLILSGAEAADQRARLLRQMRKIGRRQHDDIVIRPPWGANDSIWAVEIGKVLEKHYGGFNWLIGVWSDQGAVVIRCADVPTMWQIIIRMDDMDYPGLNIVKRLAGEYLERLGLRRARVDHDAVAELPTASTRAVIDLAGVPQSNYGAAEVRSKPREIQRLLDADRGPAGITA